MAGNTGLFIVLIIFCILSIITSTLFTYTCTDGTWDFDNFEGGKCVKWPGGDDSSGVVVVVVVVVVAVVVILQIKSQMTMNS